MFKFQKRYEKNKKNYATNFRDVLVLEPVFDDKKYKIIGLCTCEHGSCISFIWPYKFYSPIASKFL